MGRIMKEITFDVPPPEITIKSLNSQRTSIVEKCNYVDGWIIVNTSALVPVEE